MQYHNYYIVHIVYNNNNSIFKYTFHHIVIPLYIIRFRTNYCFSRSSNLIVTLCLPCHYMHILSFSLSLSLNLPNCSPSRRKPPEQNTSCNNFRRLGVCLSACVRVRKVGTRNVVARSESCSAQIVLCSRTLRAATGNSAAVPFACRKD